MRINTRYSRAETQPPADPLQDSVTCTIPVHQRAPNSLNCYPVNAGLEQSQVRLERAEQPGPALAKGMKLWRLRFGRDI
jgi:hypothetical protein